MLFDADLDTLLSLGYTRDECEFCLAVITYKYNLIKKHLYLGTSADVNIGNRRRNEQDNGQHVDDAYNAWCVCNTAYCDSYAINALDRFIKEGYEKRIVPVDWRDLQELLRAGAYTQLEKPD